MGGELLVRQGICTWVTVGCLVRKRIPQINGIRQGEYSEPASGDPEAESEILRSATPLVVLRLRISPSSTIVYNDCIMSDQDDIQKSALRHECP